MATKKLQKPKTDTELLAMLKASGILTPDVTLDELVKLSAKLGAGTHAAGFIFRDFLYRPC